MAPWVRFQIHSGKSCCSPRKKHVDRHEGPLEIGKRTPELDGNTRNALTLHATLTPMLLCRAILVRREASERRRLCVPPLGNP